MPSIRSPAGDRGINQPRLGIKVTVTAGQVQRFCGRSRDPAVRGDGRGRHPPLRRYRPRLLIGNRSQAEVIGQFGEHAQLGDWRSGKSGEYYNILAGLKRPVEAAPWVDVPEVEEDLARPFILRPIYERIRSGQKDFLADLRPSTALFLNFSGVDYDADNGRREAGPGRPLGAVRAGELQRLPRS
jgi:hypothetical protein